MKIELNQISIRALTEGYINDEEEGYMDMTENSQSDQFIKESLFTMINKEMQLLIL